MAFAVFLRAANVDGRSVFRPSHVARDLDDLGVASLGAAGTFAVAEGASARAVEARFRDALPVDVDVYVLPAKDALALVRDGPGDGDAFVSALAKKTRPPSLPAERPEGPSWQVRVVEVRTVHAVAPPRRPRRPLLPQRGRRTRPRRPRHHARMGDDGARRRPPHRMTSWLWSARRAPSGRRMSY